MKGEVRFLHQEAVNGFQILTFERDGERYTAKVDVGSEEKRHALYVSGIYHKALDMARVEFAVRDVLNADTG